MQAYTVHWLAVHFPELGVNVEVDGDTYRQPVPLLGCPQMFSCSSCRGVLGRMEMCSQCGMTGWREGCGSRLELLALWGSEGSTLAVQLPELLQLLRIRSPDRPNMVVPDNTPPLPLWRCKCNAWHHGKDTRCSTCASGRTCGVRLKWGGVYTSPASAVQLTARGKDGWRLPVLQAALRQLLRAVGGGSHPWEHCTMGPVWTLAQNKVLLALQGLGSARHPGGAHPHAPLMLTITPAAAELSCSACKFTTGKRPIYLPQLFPVAGARSCCSAYPFEHGDTRIAWMMRMLDEGYRKRAT
jgi:hypothetical protein